MFRILAAAVAAFGLLACSSDDPAPLPEASTSAVSTTPTTSASNAPPSSTSPAATTRRPDFTALPPLPQPTPATSTSAATQTTRAYPVDPAVHSSWTPRAHHDYPATDIFAATDCGTRLRSPVTGRVAEVIANRYDPDIDDPATRGGNAVSIIGTDGVRYYLAHFQSIDGAIVPGAAVTAGQFLGLMGTTGSSSACHLHFGLSLPCPANDWWVRRGVIWPDDYLASWRDGGNAAPAAELRTWFAAHPNACRSPQDLPYPVG